jgi:hypothetical protein
MFQMLQQHQFSVYLLGQNRGTERLHNLLDGYTLAGKLVFS